ncbi:hypothetical protein HNR39_000581 [Glaciimonas immobilis]|uniref:Uncharacterized protein n=1 Tax=Glaciimonas immobilis TaxID=728004 RepID=A0A840RQ80_9BURK|nr:hypothetical protein [Glaciimonas immobilis]
MLEIFAKETSPQQDSRQLIQMCPAKAAVKVKLCVIAAEGI